MIFLGECDKYDLVVCCAALIKAISNSPVFIVSDNLRSYKYFGEEVCGIPISKGSVVEPGSVVLYDCYNVLVPDVTDTNDIVLVTTLERPVLEFALDSANLWNINTMVVYNQDCIVSEKVIDVKFERVEHKHYIEENVTRRLDMLYEELINITKIEKSFRSVVTALVASHLKLDSKQVSSYWEILEKTLYGESTKKRGLFG